MISSVIWDKSAPVNFNKADQIAQENAICSLQFISAYLS